ncbi:MAG: proline dehydrogenase family protein [Actinomycetota bacterium]
MMRSGVEGRDLVVSRTLLWASERPSVRRLVTGGRLSRAVVERFVAGEHLDDAITAIEDLNRRDIGGILDLLGEGVRDAAGAVMAADEYRASIKSIEVNGIDTTVSVKLTQLGLVFDKDGCIRHLRELATEAHAIGKTLEIDMEQSEFVTDTLDVYRTLRKDFDDVRVAVQVYLRRTPADLESLADLEPKIRLVKGAYAEPEAIAFQKKAEVDAQFEYLTGWLFEHGTDPAIGTHDPKLLRHAQSVAERHGGRRSFEIQMLYGVGRELQERLVGEGYRVRVYVPFGAAWYPYLMRRIAERPANIRFFLRALLRG